MYMQLPQDLVVRKNKHRLSRIVLRVVTRGSWAGWLWPQVSHGVAVELLVELKIWLVLRICSQARALLGGGLISSPCGPVPGASPKAANPGKWESERAPKTEAGLSNLTTAGACCRFCSKLLGTQTEHYSRGPHRSVNTGGGIYCGTS